MAYVFRDYDKMYPDLVYEVLDYFSTTIRDGKSIGKRSVLRFCELKKNLDDQEGGLLYQPDTINRICQILCKKNLMIQVKNDTGIGLNNNYLFVPSDRKAFEQNKQRLKYYFNSMVYGFEYIYNLYKDVVVPLVWETKEHDYHMGTGFKYRNGIVTAKHCIEDVVNLKIKGFSAKDLNGKNIYIADNDGVDIAFIETNQQADPMLYADKGDVLQEVLVMGYPMIPAFTDFLTVEKATISSKAEARITPTKGSIAAYGNEYLTKMEAMLITAKIRGGNSGGPVINENGCIVGVACHLLDYTYNDDNKYDDLGYGVAVPIRYVDEIIAKKQRKLDVKNNFFIDYE